MSLTFETIEIGCFERDSLSHDNNVKAEANAAK